jgi:MYXO-CTERM domain-containing protein
MDRSREWIRPRNTGGPATYSVTARRVPPLPDNARTDLADAELLELPPGLQRDRWNALLATWQVPADPVPALARIGTMLQRHCRYERREPSGPFGNALENFLFAEDDRHGYCMHFASAAAVLLRLRGVPCRIAIGVHGGEPDPSQPGTRRYTSEHAHAWVEVPFAGRGFEVFDPTPATERGQHAPAGTLGSGPVPTLPDEERTRGSMLPWSVDDPTLGVPVAIAAAIGLLLLLLLRRRHRQAGAPTALAEADATPVRHARRLLATLLQELAAAGHGRAPGRTLEAYSRDLAARSWLAAEVEAAFLAWQQVRFGEQPFDAARERLLQQGIAIARAMRARTSGVPTA